MSAYKKVIVVYRFAADLPADELGGRTPMETARMPAADELARSGRCGFLAEQRAPEMCESIYFVAEILGVERKVIERLQPGPLEAALLEEDKLAGYDFAYCGSFVTLDGETIVGECGGSVLSLDETVSLTEALVPAASRQGWRMEVTGPGRVLLLCRAGEGVPFPGYPPLLAIGEKAGAVQPRGHGGEIIRKMFDLSRESLSGHPVNEVRIDLGENPAHGLMLWGGGVLSGKIQLREESAARTVLFTGEAALCGLARLVGIESFQLRSYEEMLQGQPAFRLAEMVSALRKNNLVLIYAGGTTAGFGRDSVVEKVRLLERLDARLLAPLMEVLESERPFRVFLGGDRVFSSRDGRPVAGEAPFVLAGEGITPDGVEGWSEGACAAGSLGVIKAGDILRLLERG